MLKNDKNNQYEDLGYAKIDHNRKERSERVKWFFAKENQTNF